MVGGDADRKTVKIGDGWEIDVPSSMAEEREEDNALVLWDERRTIRINTVTVAGGRDGSTISAEEMAGEEDARHRVARDDGVILELPPQREETIEGERVWTVPAVQLRRTRSSWRTSIRARRTTSSGRGPPRRRSATASSKAAGTEKDGIVNLTRGSVQVRVGGRAATVQGELLARARGRPEFVAYRKQVSWDDGAPVTEDDREAILRALQDSARRQKIALEVE